MNTYHKIIGYFAYLSGTPNVICDGDACLIAGSEQKMIQYIRSLTGIDPKTCTIKKTRWEEIWRGMQRGGVYTLDEEAYGRLAEVFSETGALLAEFLPEEASRPAEHAIPLKRVKWLDLQEV